MLSAVLLLGLAAQLALPPATLPSDAPRRAAPLPPAPGLQPVAEYPAILETPLFSPSRAGAASAAGGVPFEGFAILGSAAGRDFASLVVRAPDGAIRNLEIGDMIKNWKLAGIGKQVIFERDGRQRIMTLPEPPAAQPPKDGPIGKPNFDAVDPDGADMNDNDTNQGDTGDGFNGKETQ